MMMGRDTTNMPRNSSCQAFIRIEKFRTRYFIHLSDVLQRGGGLLLDINAAKMLLRQNVSCSRQPEELFQQRPVELTHVRLQLTQTGADVDGNGEEQQREQLRLCSQLCLWPCSGGTEELPETCQQRSRSNPSGQHGAATPAGLCVPVGI